MENTYEQPKYLINGDDLISLRVATKGFLRELEERIYENRNLETGFNTYWKNRIVELKELLEKTSWDKVPSATMSK